MTTTERLLAAAEPIWESYHEHPFVAGVREGTLDKAKFRGYLVQDYLYLVEYVKVFAVGIAKTSRLEIMLLFSKYIEAILHGEMDLHNGYMGRMSIEQDELDRTPAALDNRSYTSYMLAVAYAGGDAETLAAVLSCALSYEAIARRMVQVSPACIHDPFYGDWVRSYLSDSYHESNRVLIGMMDALAAAYDEAQLCRLEDIFCTCSRYEGCFWDMAWEQRD